MKTTLDINNLVILLVLFYIILRHRNHFENFVKAIQKRIENGDSVKISNIVTIGQSTGKLSIPTGNDKIKDDHIAIIHRSWRRKDKDTDFPGEKMHQIHLTLFGEEATLDKVEYVVYRLDPSYPKSKRYIDDRSNQFGFYELANGYSLVRAEVKIKNQYEPVLLSRFIDLTDESESLKDSGYLKHKRENP